MACPECKSRMVYADGLYAFCINCGEADPYYVDAEEPFESEEEYEAITTKLKLKVFKRWGIDPSDPGAGRGGVE